MEEKYRNNQIFLEFNDLIDDAIKGAIARRYQAINPEDSLLSLSDEEMSNIIGGIKPSFIKSSPIILGKFLLPLPIRIPPVGLIYKPEILLLE